MKVDIRSQFDFLAESTKNRISIGWRWEWNVKKFVQTARSQHGRINQLRTIRRRNHKDTPSTIQPIHLRQKLIDHPFANASTTTITASFGTKRVQLIKENDAGTAAASTFEDDTDGSFAFSDVFIEEFGTFDGDEVGSGFVGDGFCKKCLSTSRRTIQQNPSRQRQSQSLKSFWMANRFQNAQRQFLSNTRQSSHIAPRHIRDRGKALAFRRGLDVWKGR
mmetsp:Transcript_41500/g.74807  ORF Transcript_41500/g.74807 Transcript_41500/m.74807 type:complete len:220 (-) Transcript_41500:599-1258(-)